MEESGGEEEVPEGAVRFELDAAAIEAALAPVEAVRARTG
jgi:hypothetical protein